jgi:putative ABC transport system permease protein
MLLRPRWRKVLRDLWLNKNRTIVVVLSIAVGVFAIGTIANSYIILTRDLGNTYLATNPAHATIWTFEGFDKKVVDAVENLKGIDEAEGRRRVSTRIQTGPDEWQIVWLMAIADFDDIKIDQFSSESGDWPPPNNEMLIERSTLGLLGEVGVDDTVSVKTPDGKIREMRIAGLAHDLNAAMFAFDGVGYGFITEDTLDWLGQDRNFNELRITVAENADDRVHIQAVADKARDKVEAAGSMVWFTFVPQPGKHLFLDPLIQAISLIMGAMGVMSLLLSGFLVINTISALLAQQTRQIGMMKAVGARTSQVMSMYLLMVTIFGVLALLIAVPLGAVTAYYFSGFIAGFLNFDVTNYRLPLEIFLIEVAVGLIVPLVAALYPILVGVKVTVREAVSEYGLGKGQFGAGWFDRFLLSVQNLGRLRRVLARPLLISLRNTFRRKIRLTLTLATLILAGAIFITVFNVRVSMLGTLDSWLDYFRYDVAVQFEREYRAERIIRETLKVPGVDQAEVWAFYNARRQRPDGTSSDNIILYAPPADTKLVKPTIIEGRWLHPDDENALVVNSMMLRNEPDLKVGDEVILKIEGKETSWEIVGVSTGGFPMSTMFTNYPYFSRVTNSVGRGGWVFATTETHDIDTQSEVARSMEDHFEYIGMDVGATAKIAEEMAEVEQFFAVVVVLLVSMSFLLAVIGGLGLMGTMSINVLERTREIGVMRAIGASNQSVRRIFIIEGVLIGMLSWLLGVILAFPLSRLLGNAIGQQFLNSPLNHVFSMGGMLLWLFLVVILAAVASFIPAWNASRMTVREVLAYE